MGIFAGCSTQEDKFVHGQGPIEILLSTQVPRDATRCTCWWNTRFGQFRRWCGSTAGNCSISSIGTIRSAPYVPATGATSPGLASGIRSCRTCSTIRSRFASDTSQNLQMIGAIHRAGVPVPRADRYRAGHLRVPGFSLHDELSLFR